MNPRASTFKAALQCSTDLTSGPAPDWIHLLPAGDIKTVDGKTSLKLGTAKLPLVSFDGQTQVDKALIDINHANAKQAFSGAETPAMGWITALETRNTGLWAKVEWTPRGREAITNQEYRFISGQFFVNKADGTVLSVFGASITNTPNVKGLDPLFQTADHSDNPKEEDPMKELIAALCTALGLKEDGLTPAQVTDALTALKAKAEGNGGVLQTVAKAVGLGETADIKTVLQTIADKTDSSKVVPVAAVDELKAELLTVSKKLATLQTSGARDKATAFIDDKIKQGVVGVKPLREHYITRMMTSDAEFAAVEKELAAMPVLQNGAIEPPKAAGKEGEVVLSTAELDVAKRMGIKPEDYAKTKAKIETDKEAF